MSNKRVKLIKDGLVELDNRYEGCVNKPVDDEFYRLVRNTAKYIVETAEEAKSCVNVPVECCGVPSKYIGFGDALLALKQGRHLARKGWNGRGIFIELQKPDEHSKMTHPYLFIDTTGLQSDNPYAPKDRVPWFPSQTDVLAEDWVIV